jgi:purine-nucleoside/S-methyl-5'-thioadenosine phosphorylase / adenosine deaminase
MKYGLELITPNWPAPDNIHAYSSTRISGESQGIYAGLNLAQHVGDDPQTVEQNRRQLLAALHLSNEPFWLNQVHQATVLNTSTQKNSLEGSVAPNADASFSLQANCVCAVMTADCLPVLICNSQGNKVSAVHAGWRGLAEGVIENTVAALNERPGRLMAWLGPAIGPQAFEVGEEVRHAFVEKFAQAEAAFIQNRPGHYLADIYQLARLVLSSAGVKAIYGGEYCTFNDANHFYSYRRDGTTGRQVSLIWFS